MSLNTLRDATTFVLGLYMPRRDAAELQLMPRIYNKHYVTWIKCNFNWWCSEQKYSLPHFFSKCKCSSNNKNRKNHFMQQSSLSPTVGIIPVSTINSAQTPANENLSGNQNVFCLILVINEVAALYLTSKGTRFTGQLTLHLSVSIIILLCVACCYLQETALVTRLRDIYEVLSCVTFFCWQRDLQHSTETHLNGSGEKCIYRYNPNEAGGKLFDSFCVFCVTQERNCAEVAHAVTVVFAAEALSLILSLKSKRVSQNLLSQ